MIEIFYNLFGYNKIIFLSANYYLNFSFIPNILIIVSKIFSISNFAIAYIIACIYFYFRIKKSNNQQTEFEKIYYELVRIGIAYAFFGLAFAGLKFSVNLPRPFCSLPPEDFTTILDISSERCLSSFPSAHTGLSILVAYCLWGYFTKALKICAICVIIITALSRLALAMHYPSDIAYSAIVTLLIIIFSEFTYKSLKYGIITKIKLFIEKKFFGITR